MKRGFESEEDFIELNESERAAFSAIEDPALPVVEELTADITNFSQLDLDEDLIKILTKRGWNKPTPIQAQCIPYAIKGHDIIGLAVTGSGKTGAFTIPIINHMLTNRIQPFYAVIVSPTRELCVQIAEQCRILGVMLQLRVCTIVGGLSQTEQAKDIARQPHIIVATPGRLVDHLHNTRGFTLDTIKFLVLDEADRLLSMDFEEALHEIVKGANDKRQTFLFSATMTTKLSKLQRASLNRPVKVQVDEKTQTANNLKQHIVLVPMDKKFEYAAALIQQKTAYRIIVFCNTCKIANVLNSFLQRLGHSSVALSGDMDQKLRLGALNKFKSRRSNILITTEVAARGMDLPDVNFVVNFDVPTNHKDYIHRVGRTARAGKHGCSYTFVTKLDVVQYKIIESKIFGDDESKWPSVDTEITEVYKVLGKSVNFAALKSEAEKDYLDARGRNMFKKRK